jgi:hypothetical protein
MLYFIIDYRESMLKNINFKMIAAIGLQSISIR